MSHFITDQQLLTFIMLYIYSLIDAVGRWILFSIKTKQIFSFAECSVQLTGTKSRDHLQNSLATVHLRTRYLVYSTVAKLRAGFWSLVQ